MTQSHDPSAATRREFLKRSGSFAAGATVLGRLPAAAHARSDDTIRLALIGCGPRGTGAVRDALSVPGKGPVQLFAMADLRESKLSKAHDAIAKKFPDEVDVPEDRRFLGFDAYRKAIDTLRPGDIAMCTTRAYARPTHVEYAVERGINVFMEKPFAPDPGGLHRMLRAGKKADENGAKVAAGLQCRHSPARQALIAEIAEGAMGDIHLIRANRLGGGRWLADQGERRNDLMSQLEFGKIHLLWVGSGHMIDNLIHQIDECCWLKGSWPVAAHGLGGRVHGSRDHGQNIDSYAMELTFADGAKAFCGFSRVNRTRSDFATYVHGTKCAAQFSGRTHAATVHRFRGQRTDADEIAWTPRKDAVSPWQYEWNDFIAAIRADRPYNETERAVYSDFASLMGRAACHTGQNVTWEQVTGSDFRFFDYVDDLDYGSRAPVEADEHGQFCVPVPGEWTEL